ATEGPYSWTRNPLYFGSFLLQLGFGVMSGSWIAAAITIVPSFVIYPNVIRNEEGHLERLFPEQFREYASRVPRFIPRNPHYCSREPVFSFTQWMKNREYNTVLGFGAVLAVFLVKWRLL